MCRFIGFYHPHKHYLKESRRWRAVLANCTLCLERESLPGSETVNQEDTALKSDPAFWLWEHGGLGAARHLKTKEASSPSAFSIFVHESSGQTFALIMDGELYNSCDLRDELRREGYSFETSSDQEIALKSYLEWGTEFVNHLNGSFAIAIMDTAARRLLLFRDPIGSKPLFYTVIDGELLFSSRLKGLLSVPGINAVLSREGLNEIFSLGPARTPGAGILKGMKEVPAGHFLLYGPDGISLTTYWKPVSRPHTDSWERTVKTTAFLVEDAVKRQMNTVSPLCSFLSGGLDSSLVSSICSRELKKQGKKLTTFSFDFSGNKDFFKPNSFQPSRDQPYAEKMAAFLGTDHHTLECTSKTQADRLMDSVLAHDLPAMGDIDSSMLHFCSMAAGQAGTALTGECADEIFGGYPWFHRPECFNAHTFPWTMDLAPRKALLRQDFLEYLNMEEYVAEAYEASVSQTPMLPEDGPETRARRRIAWLNLTWFMQTLLNRMERASSFNGLTARVPFADRRIIEYLWNVPWEMKAKNGIPKGLLREAAKGFLPGEILNRRKSPYPKTYDTAYEALLADRLREAVHETNSPLLEFIDKKKLENFLSSPSDYGKPWYGQLMAGPQMMAYLLQIHFWIRAYKITVAD